MAIELGGQGERDRLINGEHPPQQSALWRGWMRDGLYYVTTGVGGGVVAALADHCDEVAQEFILEIGQQAGIGAAFGLATGFGMKALFAAGRWTYQSCCPSTSEDSWRITKGVKSCFSVVFGVGKGAAVKLVSQTLHGAVLMGATSGVTDTADPHGENPEPDIILGALIGGCAGFAGALMSEDLQEAFGIHEE